MRFFSFFSPFIALFLIPFIAGCNSSNSLISENKKVCPKCSMTLPESNIYTAKLQNGSGKYHFDDLGCLILWAKDKNINIAEAKTEVFSNDTHRYIEGQKAHFSVNEKTPMGYGFGAYENEKANTIIIDEVALKMLRGEHMANPKIRKQILAH